MGGRQGEKEEGAICTEQPGGAALGAGGLAASETGTGTLQSLHESATNQLLLWRKQEKMKEERRGADRGEREGRERWR